MKTRAVIYTRVSTTDGRQDVRNQLLQLRRFARTQGWTVVAEYTDAATASNGNRAGFKRLWAAAARHSFDVLLFWSLDRLTREGAYKTLTYLRRLTDAGVAYRSYTEQYIDSLGVFAEAIVGILAAIAQQERLRIGERTRAGLVRARAAGTRLGRPPVQVDVGRARRLRKQGLSLRAIAGRLRVSAALVCQVLRQPQPVARRRQA
jgi:DNA invertase Pin-like site-specific DNA recombinase